MEEIMHKAINNDNAMTKLLRLIEPTEKIYKISA